MIWSIAPFLLFDHSLRVSWSKKCSFQLDVHDSTLASGFQQSIRYIRTVYWGYLALQTGINFKFCPFPKAHLASWKNSHYFSMSGSPGFSAYNVLYSSTIRSPTIGHIQVKVMELCSSSSSAPR